MRPIVAAEKKRASIIDGPTAVLIGQVKKFNIERGRCAVWRLLLRFLFWGNGFHRGFGLLHVCYVRRDQNAFPVIRD